MHNAQLVFEPTLTARFLPRCGKCGHKHPLAYQPPIESDKCLACGASVAVSPSEFTASAVATGGLGLRFGFWLLKVARRLAAFGKE